MNILRPFLCTAWLLTSAMALAGEPVVPWLSGEHMLSSDQETLPRIVVAGADDHPLRPRLSVSLLDTAAPFSNDGLSVRSGGWFGQRFFWSLGTEYRPTLLQPRAHIHCQRGIVTATAYLAEECRFVDHPLPNDSVSLVQVRGEWMATPEISLGLGVFRGEGPTGFAPAHDMPLTWPGPRRQAEGIDLDFSIGLEVGRLGDLLMDLQVSRYRDRYPGLFGLDDTWSAFERGGVEDDAYHHAAQLSLGWRRGDFSGGIHGHYRDNVTRLGSGQPPASLSTFDIEFSWRTSWNAMLSFGASNLLRSQPETGPEGVLPDPADGTFGRIPYVRYKQDL